MKKCCFSIAALSLSALVFFSCKKDEKPVVTGDMMTFTGRIGGGGAKTEIDGFEMTWSEGDVVRINGVDCDSKLTSDRKTATFIGTVAPADKYEAYYPVNLYDIENDKHVLPAVQYYDTENVNNLSQISPMYAGSTTTSLQFHNICAMVKLKMVGEGTVKVKEIAVSAKKNGYPAFLSGEFNIEGNAFAGYYAEISPTGGSTDLTLNCGETGVNLSNDPENPSIFYITMPQGEYTDLVFTLKDGTGGFWKSSPVTKELVAGAMYVKEQGGISVVDPNKLHGKFSVADGKQVQFSCGNLQFHTTDKKWRFAEHQYEVSENDLFNHEQTDVYVENSDEWIDLFSWGTSGQEHGAVCYQPWSTSTVDADYYAYGDPSNDLNSQTTATADWGYSYCIQEKINPTTWRTLTGGEDGEYNYLFTKRENASNLYGLGAIDGMTGLMLLPDDWTNCPGDLTFIPGGSNWANLYTLEQWAEMESAGAVFLRAAGHRTGNTFASGGTYGLYCSSTHYDDENIYYLRFRNKYAVMPVMYNVRCTGFSVRLVQEIK